MTSSERRAYLKRAPPRQFVSCFDGRSYKCIKNGLNGGARKSIKFARIRAKSRGDHGFAR